MDYEWRTRLTQSFRQKNFNRIMDTLQRRMLVQGQDGMNERWNIAKRLEEDIFFAATDQHDYVWRISLKMLDLEFKAPNPPNNALLSSTSANQSSGNKPLDATSIDSSLQTGQSGIVDLQDYVWAMMQDLKEKYLNDMRDLVNMLATRAQQPMPAEQHQKLSHYKSVLQRMIPYLVAPKGSLPSEFIEDQVEAFEKQTVSIMETYKRRRKNSQQQQTPLPPPGAGQVQSIQQQVEQPSQALQQDKAVQQTNQIIAPVSTAASLQGNISSNNSMSILQPTVPSLQQDVIINTAQSSLLSGLQGGTVNGLNQNNILYFQQSSLTSSQSNITGMQQHQQPQLLQQEQQQLFQQRMLQEQEQLKQQFQQHQLQQQQSVQQHQQQTQRLGSINSSSQTGQSGIVDLQDNVWAKMQDLKEKYLNDMRDLFISLATRSQQPMPAEWHQQLSRYKSVLQRMMPYLVAPKGSLPSEFKQDKVEAFEKQIVSIMETFKRRRQNPQQQQTPPPPPGPGQQVQSIQQQVQQPSQALQQDKAVQQTNQIIAPISTTASLQGNISSNNSMSILQPTVPSLQQNVINTAQSSTLNGLQGGTVNGMNQNNISSFQQSSLTSSQSNITGMQQQQQQQVLQQEQQQLFQQRMLKEEQLKQQFPQRQLQQQQQQQSIQQHQQQKQQLGPQPMQVQPNQHLQTIPDTVNDSKMAKQTAAMKQVVLLQQHHQMSPRTILQQLQQQKTSSSQTVSSPQMSSPPQMSPQSDLQNIGTPALQIPKVGTPLQAATPPFMIPSPSLLPVASPMAEDPDLKPQTPVIATATPAPSGQTLHSAANTPSNGQLVAIGTPGFSVSPLLNEYTPSPQSMTIQDRPQTFPLGSSSEDRQTITEPPLERLVKAINSMSSKALSSAIGDMNSLISLSDKLGGSAPGSQSRAAVGEDLAQVTKCRSQARAFSSQEGSTINRRKRRIDSMALSVVSFDGSVANNLQRVNGSDLLEVESTATSRIKRFKIEISQSLEEEINQINESLIDTRVEINYDGTEEAVADGKEGTMVTCSYNAVAMNPNVTFRSSSFNMVSLSPLHLLVPPYYPDCSPIVLTDHLAPDFNYPMSCLARDEFSRVVRCLSQPVSLEAMVKAWDECARNAMAEAAALQGGGCFSSSFGAWESCVSAQ